MQATQQPGWLPGVILSSRVVVVTYKLHFEKQDYDIWGNMQISLKSCNIMSDLGYLKQQCSWKVCPKLVINRQLLQFVCT